MAGPVEGLSAAVNIITVMHLIYRTIRRLKEYADSAVEVPRRVRPVLRCVRMLSVTLSNIEGIQTELAIPRDIDEAIRGLKELIEELEVLLPRVMKFPGDGRWDRIRKGFRSMRIEKMLMEHVDEMNSSTIQLGAWIGSVDLRRSVLGVLLLRWFTRKRLSRSDWNGRNIGQALRGGCAASCASESPSIRRRRKVAYRTIGQTASLPILNTDYIPIIRTSRSSEQPVRAHELSWVDPKFRTAGTELNFAMILGVAELTWRVYSRFDEAAYDCVNLRNDITKLRAELQAITQASNSRGTSSETISKLSNMAENMSLPLNKAAWGTSSAYSQPWLSDIYAERFRWSNRNPATERKVGGPFHEDIYRHKDYTGRFSNHERSSHTPVLDARAIMDPCISRHKLRYQEIQPMMERDLWHDGNLEGGKWNRTAAKDYKHSKRIGSAISVS